MKNCLCCLPNSAACRKQSIDENRQKKNHCIERNVEMKKKVLARLPSRPSRCWRTHMDTATPQYTEHLISNNVAEPGMAWLHEPIEEMGKYRRRWEREKRKLFDSMKIIWAKSASLFLILVYTMHYYIRIFLCTLLLSPKLSVEFLNLVSLCCCPPLHINLRFAIYI